MMLRLDQLGEKIEQLAQQQQAQGKQQQEQQQTRALLKLGEHQAAEVRAAGGVMQRLGLIEELLLAELLITLIIAIRPRLRGLSGGDRVT
jgi:hypothetical protein